MLDKREDAQRIGTGDLEADTAQRTLGQPFLEAFPGVSAVGRPKDTALGAAAVEAPRGPAAGVGAGVENGRIAGVHLEIHHPGVGGDVEHVLPGRTPVFGAEDAALAAGTPERPHRGNEGAPRPVRIGDDPPDVLALLEAGVPEGVAAVERHVDPVAEGGTLPVRRLAGAHPDGRRIGRGERDRADGRGREVVEDGVPGSAVVPGPEQASRRSGRVELPRTPGHDRQVGDPPGHHRRSDGAERQIVHDRQRPAPAGFLAGGRQRQQDETGGEQEKDAVDHSDSPDG